MRYDLPAGVTQQRRAVNGVELDVLEAGPDGGPIVVLAHGFPESAWSWRHQMVPLASAGWKVIAPDQRGYAGSSCPTDVESYGIRHLTGDLLALVDQVGGEGAQAVFVGHDWGALIVWDLARLHPERCRATIGVSVPLVDWPASPTALFKAMYGDNRDFFYMLYFQTVGPAETELGRDPRTTMRRILFSASGDLPAPTEAPAPRPAATTGFLDVMAEPPADWLGSGWCAQADLDAYTEVFTESGYFGPVSYYRNLDANYALVKDYPVSRITQPTAFIGGTRDMVIARDPSGLDRMAAALPNHLGNHLIDGAGHWTQQERPEEFTAALLGFLAKV